MKKVMVELADEMIVGFLRECLHNIIKSSLWDGHHAVSAVDYANLAEAIITCEHLNGVLRYLGGSEENIAALCMQYAVPEKEKDDEGTSS
jgi:hypothetical protein